MSLACSRVASREDLISVSSAMMVSAGSSVTRGVMLVEILVRMVRREVDEARREVDLTRG